jgi:opacity protein-like surface antigen
MTQALPAAALRRSLACLVALPGLLAMQSSNAADFSLGIGAGGDHGRVDCVAAYECDRSSSHVKLTAAYLVSDTLDLQLAYFDAGKFKGGDLTPLLGTPFGGSFKVSGVGLTVGYRYGFAPQWSATARAGLSSMRTRFDYASPFSAIASVSETKVEPLIGLGIGYAVTPSIRIGLDYDLTRFKVYSTQGPLHMLGLAAQFSF